MELCTDGTWIDVTSKKRKCGQFKNLHRFSLFYLRPVKIILNVKMSAKLLIKLACSKLQSSNVNLCTYRKKSKSKC